MQEGDPIEKMVEDVLNYVDDPVQRATIQKDFDITNLRENARIGKSPTLEFQRRDKEGKQVWTKLISRLIIDPITNHILTIYRVYDFSEQKELNLFLRFITAKNYDFAVRLDLLAPQENFRLFMSPQIKSENINISEGQNFFNKFYKNYYQKINKIKIDKSVIPKNRKEVITFLNKSESYNIPVNVLEEGSKKVKNIEFFYFDESKKYLCLVQSDITKQVKELLKAKEKAEEAQKQADKAKKDAIIANKAKSNFLARMSHDMRTPMSAIIGMANLGLSEIKDEQAKQYFNQIKTSSNFLLGLINDVLDFHLIEEGNTKLEQRIVDRKEFIDNIISIIKQRANNRKIKFEYNCNLEKVYKYMKFDPLRVSQILLNVLNNALKYTEINGNVIWKIWDTKENGLFIMHHQISDDGIGMSEEFQKNMYDSFVQEKSNLFNLEGGCGLGLAITKKLVDLMDGHIKCKSELGKGTTFFIDLPIELPNEEEIDSFENMHEKFDVHNSVLKGKKILLCEDNQLNILILKKILNEVEIITDVAENGLVGVEKVKNNLYDAILMDIRMPIMNGLRATVEIRKFNKTIPIIALSANAYREDIEKSLNAGMNYHLSKPIQPEEIYSTLKKLFE